MTVVGKNGNALVGLSVWVLHQAFNSYIVNQNYLVLRHVNLTRNSQVKCLESLAQVLILFC